MDVDPDLSDVDQSGSGSTTMVRTLLFKVCASRIYVWIVPYRSTVVSHDASLDPCK